MPSLPNTRCSMGPQEAGDGLEIIVEVQDQVKGQNQRGHEHKWQGWQNWTNEKLATELTKDDQQPVYMLDDGRHTWILLFSPHRDW